jgi:hypothetical protein
MQLIDRMIKTRKKKRKKTVEKWLSGILVKLNAHCFWTQAKEENLIIASCE